MYYFVSLSVKKIMPVMTGLGHTENNIKKLANRSKVLTLGRKCVLISYGT